MKILKSIGLYFIYPFLMFLLGIFAHMGYVKYFYPNKYIRQEETYFLEDSSLEAVNTTETITTCDTAYYVVEYNLGDNSEKEYQEKIPDKYLGMNRQTLQEALEEYCNHPTLEDVEKGFVNASLISFSSREVKISKTFQPPEETGYYLMVSDGKIVVMEEDKETVYLTTDIYAEALSDALKSELIKGKYITNIEDLYGFLESHTS